MSCLLTEAVTLNTDEVMKSSFVSDFFWTLENMQQIIVRKNRKDKRGRLGGGEKPASLCLQGELLNINIERYNQPYPLRKKNPNITKYSTTKAMKGWAGMWGQARLKSNIKKEETNINTTASWWEYLLTNWTIYFQKKNFCYVLRLHANKSYCKRKLYFDQK